MTRGKKPTKRGKKPTKPGRTITAPPVDLEAAVRARLDARLAELRAELVAHPDALLALPAAGPDVDDINRAMETIKESRGFLELPVVALTPPGTVPVTLREGLAAVEAIDAAASFLSSYLAPRMVEEIKRCAELLVEPKLREAVMARPYVVQRWPLMYDGMDRIRINGWAFPEAKRRGMSGEALSLGMLAMERSTWPGDAAPLDVARWARKALNGVSTDNAGDELLTKAERGEGTPAMWTANAGGHRYPAAGLALLYLAEREVEAGLRRPVVAIDAGKEHHAMLQGWRDTPKDAIRHRAAGLDVDILDGRVELLLPGTSTQLALPLPMGGLSASAVELLRRLRGPLGLRHWCALLRLLSVEGGRRGWVRWTLDEHLEAMGYNAATRNDPTKREEAAAEVEELTKLELVVYDAKNTMRHRAPLLTVGTRFERIAGSKWRLEGMELRINELLYSGVRAPSGSLGKDWMPAPVELAKLDHVRLPYAHGLGMLLPIRQRWDLGDGRSGTRLSGRKLLELAGIPYTERRAAVAWRKLERTLEALVGVELLTYAWDGEPWTLDGYCDIAPAGWMMDRVGRGLVPVERPAAVIPRTGAELMEWRTARGWSQRAAAARLGVGQSSLSNAEAKPDAEVSAKLLAALKRMAMAPVA